jgi:ubiquinone/menaquinone biosynthesis C-methylase UbiE
MIVNICNTGTLTQRWRNGYAAACRAAQPGSTPGLCLWVICENMTIKGSTSFYKTEDEFKKYLAMTSYYSGLQRNLIALVPSETRTVVDLATGTGSTAIQIARKCSRGVIHGIDKRNEILKIAEEIAKREHVSNIIFERADMNNLDDYLSKNNMQPDVITALYAFHHINDPLENKQRVVNEMYEKMKSGGKVIIADLYLDVDYNHPDYAERTKLQYKSRGEEAYNSVFWAVVREMTNKGKDVEETLRYARDIAEYSRTSELNAMNGALGRSKAKVPEYIITKQQLKQIFKDTGFGIKVFQPINSIGEAIMMAEKP